MPSEPFTWIINIAKYLRNHLSTRLELKLDNYVAKQVVHRRVNKELDIKGVKRVETVLIYEILHNSLHGLVVRLFQAVGTEFKNITTVSHA